jgi:hypothetical protein
MNKLSRSSLATKISIACVGPAIWFSDFKNWKRPASKKPPLGEERVKGAKEAKMVIEAKFKTVSNNLLADPTLCQLNRPLLKKT